MKKNLKMFLLRAGNDKFADLFCLCGWQAKIVEFSTSWVQHVCIVRGYVFCLISQTSDDDKSVNNWKSREYLWEWKFRIQ